MSNLVSYPAYRVYTVPMGGLTAVPLEFAGPAQLLQATWRALFPLSLLFCWLDFSEPPLLFLRLHARPRRLFVFMYGVLMYTYNTYTTYGCPRPRSRALPLLSPLN